MQSIGFNQGKVVAQMNPNENLSEFTAAIDRQWNLMLTIQQQCATYPSLENLEKAAAAIEGYKYLIETLLTAKQIMEIDSRINQFWWQQRQ